MIKCEQCLHCSHFIASRPIEIASRPIEIASRPIEIASRPIEIASRPIEIASRPIEIASRPAPFAYAILLPLFIRQFQYIKEFEKQTKDNADNCCKSHSL